MKRATYQTPVPSSTRARTISRNHFQGRASTRPRGRGSSVAAFSGGGRALHASVLWWWGDWLNYGEAAYAQKYTKALDTMDYSYGTLRNAKFVSGRLELSRRRDNLSWSHHLEVPQEYLHVFYGSLLVGLSLEELADLVFLRLEEFGLPG